MQQILVAFALVVGFIFSFTAGADTEIQMFLRYHGPKSYGLKIVSTSENPVSAYFVHVHPGQAGAACYNGTADDASALFRVMVGLFNSEYNRNIQVDFEQIYIGDSPDVYLRVYETDENGERYLWFPHMNVCSRGSTQSERWPTLR